ncbi:hypothetical protein INT43_001444 [Umbelopsis isabellina]|uniref:Uncharacterized protein n=1 Tax=Mortierella isabellina TaxID=91625 RepID=A0A8H7U9Q6_MORIS|nr:hypothetical protein INT43_001444 [Umbelopsis isabellina]
MQYQVALFFCLALLTLVVSAKDHDRDNYGYNNNGYGNNGYGGGNGWVDQNGHWHNAAAGQTVMTGLFAIPAAVAAGLLAL